MERMFRTRWQDRAGAVFMLLICAACIGMGIYFPFARPFRPEEAWTPWAGLALFSALGGGLGAFLLWGLLETFTVYSADEDGITRKTLFSTRRMAWREVASYRTRNSGPRTTYILKDIYGATLTVYLGLAPNAEELAGRLETVLAPLKEQAVREIGAAGYEWRAPKALAGIGIVGILMGIGMAAASTFLVSTAGQYQNPTAVGIMGGIGVIMGVAFCFMGPYLMSLYTRVSEAGIVSGNIFSKREILFSQVRAVWSRDQTLKNGVVNSTWIEGQNGKKIQLMEGYPDYAKVVAYIRERVGEAAASAGDAKLPVIQRTESRNGMIATAIAVPLLIALLVVMSVDPVRRLRNHFEMNRLARPVTGTVVRLLTTRHNKSDYYAAMYTFTADGQTITDASLIPDALYQRLRPRDPVIVDVVPGRPKLHRMHESLGKRVAIGDLVAPAVYGALALFAGAGAAIKQILKRRQAKGAPAA